MSQSRFDAGINAFNEIDAEVAAKFQEKLNDYAPKLVQHTIEFAFGDILDNCQFDFKTRELLTIAMLAGMANAQPQLSLHIKGALKGGATEEEVVETIMLVAVYAGFPAALNALSCAVPIFAQKDNMENSDFWR